MSTILVVEDNELNLDMLARRLQRSGYEVLMAVDGLQGVTLAIANLPDLILMDLRLPVMDGWEAARRLRSTPATRAIPIIALTAHAIAGDRERALEAGCNDYEAKPVDYPRLLSKIRLLLDRAKAAADRPAGEPEPEL